MIKIEELEKPESKCCLALGSAVANMVRFLCENGKTCVNSSQHMVELLVDEFAKNGKKITYFPDGVPPEIVKRVAEIIFEEKLL